MLITREIINKNIRFHDVLVDLNGEIDVKSYTYNHLSEMIDRYKNLLFANGARPGCSAVVGEQISLSQTAFVFACAELGVNITIIDQPHGKNPKPNTYVPGSISTKLKLMLPITYLLSVDRDYTVTNDKTRILMDVCKRTILADEFPVNIEPNDKILAKPDSIFLRCTSSGTTDTPKVLEHTHEFMSDLIKRNSKMFYGKMGVIANLNHGSSPATFFLPGLVSENVTDLYHMQANIPNKLSSALARLGEQDVDINHVMFPYSSMIDEFLSYDGNNSECILYTLSVIKKEWVEHTKTKKIKDVVSIFGTNETSGTVMINQATDHDFSENTYKKLDDFYGIHITEKNELEVGMPIYNKRVPTGDAFVKHGDKFLHLGRSNLYRINDLELDVNKYTAMLKKECDGDIIVDTNKNSIYIVLWDKTANDQIVKDIDRVMREDSADLHFVSKYDYLTQSEFLTGVKVDRQILREYFRTKII